MEKKFYAPDISKFHVGVDPWSLDGHEKNKYYVPDISEFYVGFKYEWCESEYIGDDKFNEYWEKDTFNFDTVDFFKFNDVYNKRIKYLDKEDIESLGFKYDNNAEPYPEKEPYECPIAFDLDTQLEDGICYILYLYSNNVVWIEWIKNCAGMGYIFKGTIKNKSELVKLLKQLGINEKV